MEEAWELAAVSVLQTTTQNFLTDDDIKEFSVVKWTSTQVRLRYLAFIFALACLLNSLFSASVKSVLGGIEFSENYEPASWVIAVGLFSAAMWFFVSLIIRTNIEINGAVQQTRLQSGISSRLKNCADTIDNIVKPKGDSSWMISEFPDPLEAHISMLRYNVPVLSDWIEETKPLGGAFPPSEIKSAIHQITIDSPPYLETQLFEYEKRKTEMLDVFGKFKVEFHEVSGEIKRAADVYSATLTKIKNSRRLSGFELNVFHAWGPVVLSGIMIFLAILFSFLETPAFLLEHNVDQAAVENMMSSKL